MSINLRWSEDRWSTISVVEDTFVVLTLTAAGVITYPLSTNQTLQLDICRKNNNKTANTPRKQQHSHLKCTFNHFHPKRTLLSGFISWLLTSYFGYVLSPWFTLPTNMRLGYEHAAGPVSTETVCEVMTFKCVPYNSHSEHLCFKYQAVINLYSEKVNILYKNSKAHISLALPFRFYLTRLFAL